MITLFRRRLFRTLLLVLCVGCYLSGCKSSPTWSSESRSPDGQMIASAKSYEGGGLGASGPSVTNLYLNWASGSQEPVQILGVHDESDKAVEARVGMQWLTPRHLEITYDSRAQVIDFQAVKWGDVNVTVRDLSTSTINKASPQK